MGALRASLGHPDPFTLNYIEVGNEVCPWHYGERDLRPLIHTSMSFANLTNVRLRKHLETNETTFQHFASYAYLSPVPSDDIDSLYTPIAFETIINGIVTVPDLITVLDSQSGSSIGTQEYR